MKYKFIIVLMVMLMGYQLKAQYVPNNSQGYQFMSLYNPSFSGIENFDDLKLSYRYQWAGFGKNAPKFVNIGFQKRIKQPLDMSYNSMRVSDFSAARAEHLPRAKRMVHALGFNLFQSRVGVLKSVGGSFTYAVHYPVTNYSKIAFGISSLIENRKLDISEVSVRDPDEYYNYLLRSSTSQTDLNLRAGLVFYGDNFYIGASYLPIVNIALQASELAMEEPFYRGSVQAGISFPVSDDITLKPSLLGLLQMNNGLVMDYNVKGVIQDKVVVGLSYRSIQSAVVLLGFNINETFSANYSYEVSTGQFRKFNDGSHEIVLSARLKNLKHYNQYLW